MIYALRGRLHSIPSPKAREQKHRRKDSAAAIPLRTSFPYKEAEDYQLIRIAEASLNAFEIVATCHPETYYIILISTNVVLNGQK
jgi:hypothetical protein